MSVTAEMNSRTGMITITICVRDYGEAGRHWRDVLSGPNSGGYGPLYIDRRNIDERRKENLWEHERVAGLDRDECPGAMFISHTGKEVSVRLVDPYFNRKLGTALGKALRPFEQKRRSDFWPVRFEFR